MDDSENELRAQEQRLLQKMFGISEWLDHYEFIEEIGCGGMGIVHRAYDHTLDRTVAIKRVKERGDGNTRQQLVREAKLMAKLAHPNIVSVFEIRERDDEAFIVMEYVEGVTLREWLRQRSRSLDEIIRVFREAAEGLSAAHVRGLIHRDFKPSNVMLGDDGRARVMDFGLALPMVHNDSELAMSASTQRSSEGMRVAGTPCYMAPEQFRGRRVDARSDQFSYCVTFYEALYGERPFAGANVEDAWRAAAKGQIRPAPVDAAVPAWLREVIVRGLEPDPWRRFDSMRSLLDALHFGQVRASVEVPGARQRGRSARRLLSKYGSVAALALTSVSMTLAAQPTMCPTVVDVAACRIYVEGDEHIDRAWIVLESGGEWEIEVDGKVLHFDCIDEHEPVSVIVSLADGGLRYWGNINVTGDDVLQLDEAVEGIPPNVSPTLARQLPSSRGRGHRGASAPDEPMPEPEPEPEPESKPEFSEASTMLPDLGGAMLAANDVVEPEPEPPPSDSSPVEPSSGPPQDNPTVATQEQPTVATQAEVLEQVRDAGKKHALKCSTEHMPAQRELKIDVTIDSNGRVREAKVLGSLRDSPLAACIVSALQGERFPSSADEISTTLSLPLRKQASLLD